MITVNNNISSNISSSQETLLREDESVLVEGTVIVESDNPDLLVISEVTQDDSSNLYIGTVTRNNTDGSELFLDTVVINNNSTVLCSQIVAKNNSFTVTKWSLVKTTGETIYTTDNYKKGSTCTINLNSVNIQPGTQLKLKALVKGKDSISNVVLQFEPNINKSANFILKGTAFKTSLSYTGITSN